MIKGSWKRDEQKAKEEENESKGSSCLPLLLHRDRSVIHHHQRVP